MCGRFTSTPFFCPKRATLRGMRGPLMLAALCLTTCLLGQQPTLQLPPGPRTTKVEKQVAVLIEKMLNRRTEHKAFADLEALGCPAVPAIIARMDDRRDLPDPRIALTNKSPDAFEERRFYTPQKVVDALDAILNQITGQILGDICSGGTEAERARTVSAWRAFLSRTPPSRLCAGG
jgi:hypothetical protein